MYTRVEESDHEVKVTHHQFFGTSVAMLITWVFIYVTFSSEQGGVLSLMGATFSLMIAGALAELTTTQIDVPHRSVTITRRRALGPTTRLLAFADVASLSTHLLGHQQWGVESVRLQLTDGESLEVGSYVLLRGEGGGLQQYLEDWFKR